MRSLLDFIVKYSYVFLFILLESVSLALLFGSNERQRMAFMTSAGRFSGSILEWRSDVKSYFGLRKENEKLAYENAMLRSRLNTVLDNIEVESLFSRIEGDYAVARVIDNSVRKDDNYITINKGRADGIERGMGVFDSRGVIGVVMLPGKKYSIVLPVLNGRSSISCKISGSNSFGFLEWYGGNPYMAYIVDMPFHTDVNPGDTVVTSGFSSAFPENIPVGIVESVEEEQLNYMLRLTVSLFVDMSDIRWVYVNTYGQDPEPEELKEELQ